MPGTMARMCFWRILQIENWRIKYSENLDQIQSKSGRNVSKWKNEVLFVDPRAGLKGNGKCVDIENHKSALR